MMIGVGCETRPQPPSPTPAPITPAVVGTPLPRPTLVDIPTLLPTQTPIIQPTATETRPLQPTPTPLATVELSEVVLALEYSIPGLGLTRTLTATFASRITLADTATGQTVVQPQQARVLLEIQSVLNELTLEPVPDGCDLCPHLSYSLPVAEQSGTGWLTDPILLASLENYFAVHLGPHWPPNTVLGLRRSASPYRPAHTVAFTDDGQMWRWSAIDSQIAPQEDALLTWDDLVGDLDVVALENSYQQECLNVARETLYFRLEETTKTVQIRCPELSLPTTLTQLYTALAVRMGTVGLAEGESDRPPLFPYTTALYYQRDDGYRLTLDENGLALIALEGEIQATANLTASLPISLTITALESGVMSPGTPELLRTFATTDTTNLPANFLMVRGPDGTAEYTWDDEVDEALEPVIAELNRLIDELVGLVPEIEEETSDE